MDSLNRWPIETRIRVVFEVWSGARTPETVFQEYGIDDEIFRDWQAEFQANAETLFQQDISHESLGNWFEAAHAVAKNLRSTTIDETDGDQTQSLSSSSIAASLSRMDYHVAKFEDDYLSQNRVPRNHIWRPYRFCSQDIVLGLTVVRHSLENNCLEVDVCLTSDIPEYESFSGARITTAFLLSEAYKCGGTMEIRFTEYVEGKRVPADIVAFAESQHVTLNHVEQGRITPSEARQFYMAITDFPPTLHSRIIEIYQQGRLSQERVCYAVAKGLWTLPEVETIVFGSQYPDNIFGGSTLPEQRHLYMHDVLHARATVMGGLLDLKLARRERIDEGTAIDLEDDVRVLEIAFDPDLYAKIYRCDEPLPIPWSGQNADLTPDESMIVLLRPRDANDLMRSLVMDLDFAAKRSISTRTFVLVPRDFQQLQSDEKTMFTRSAEERGVGILVCPETVFSLDSTAKSRLSSSRILRE